MSTPTNRPLSPHLQIYRPQLTSIRSFTHRLTGLTLGLYAIALVAWLMAAAAGPHSYAAMQSFIHPGLGQALLLGGTWCLFLHLCGGIRHLFWDAGSGFELRAIYRSGWTVVAASAGLTLAAWIASWMLSRGR